MGNLNLLPATGILNLDGVISAEDVITLDASTVQIRVNCPLCGRSSDRVHSRYTRTAADLPWQGIAVRLKIKTRRFFCDNHQCERLVFTAMSRKAPGFSHGDIRLRAFPKARYCSFCFIGVS